MKRVEVAVGVVLRAGEVFISKRADALHQGGLWEFPGGKREANESMEAALARELFEEIGIEVLAQTPLMVIEHDYADKQVRLDIRIVDKFNHEPKQKEGQIARWVRLNALDDYQFPDANRAIIEALRERGK